VVSPPDPSKIPDVGLGPRDLGQGGDPRINLRSDELTCDNARMAGRAWHLSIIHRCASHVDKLVSKRDAGPPMPAGSGSSAQPGGAARPACQVPRS
jgi:hypothetical protein